MSPDEFITLAYRTAPEAYKHISSDLVDPEIFHAWIGVTTECGESGDVVKKALIYGKEPDLVNLDEEFADKLWYIALYCKARDISFEYLFDLVIKKLQVRFPDKFTEDEAINRDVAAERRLLEEQYDQVKMTRQYIKENRTVPLPSAELYVAGTVYTFAFDPSAKTIRWVAKDA